MLPTARSPFSSCRVGKAHVIVFRNSQATQGKTCIFFTEGVAVSANIRTTSDKEEYQLHAAEDPEASEVGLRELPVTPVNFLSKRSALNQKELSLCHTEPYHRI